MPFQNPMEPWPPPPKQHDSVPSRVSNALIQSLREFWGMMVDQNLTNESHQNSIKKECQNHSVRLWGTKLDSFWISLSAASAICLTKHDNSSTLFADGPFQQCGVSHAIRMPGHIHRKIIYHPLTLWDATGVTKSIMNHMIHDVFYSTCTSICKTTQVATFLCLLCHLSVSCKCELHIEHNLPSNGIVLNCKECNGCGCGGLPPHAEVIFSKGTFFHHFHSTFIPSLLGFHWNIVHLNLQPEMLKNRTSW